MQLYPIWFVVLGIVIYALAYYVYARWYDRNVWEPDPKRATPAHMYMDGITFFPVGKWVLYGFQFKGIAGLGPILGPFIGLFYGWLPALLWILVGNFFIGWIHDYSVLFLSVRNEGKTLGPLSYELISPRARKALIGFLFFYLILLIATFDVLCSVFFMTYPQSVLATTLMFVAGIISGLLMYKARAGVTTSTIVGVIITIIGIIIGIYVPLPYKNLGFWVVYTSILLLIGGTVSLMYVTQPVIYIASFPAIAGIVLLIIGGLISPATGVAIEQPAWGGVFGMLGGMKAKSIWTVGPIWPILFVSIACGAISGWHSLVSSSGSAPLLDVETDALPVGAGSMLTEGLLALASLSAYMVLTPEEVAAAGGVKWTALVTGASKLVAPWTGGEAAWGWTVPFYGFWLEVYALTLAMLALRFFWMVWADITGAKPIISNKYVGSIIGLIIGGILAYTGAWINLWLLFGGSNQLLAGLALTLVSLYLMKIKKPSKYTLGPAIFMIITCEAALLWQAIKMLRAVALGTPIAKGPLAAPAYKGIALALNGVFGAFAIILFILGLIVAIDASKAFARLGKAEAE